MSEKAALAQPEAKRVATPPVPETEPDFAPPRRFLAPAPAEPVREQAKAEPESRPASILFAAQEEEPEPKHKGGHLWNKLREHAPLFRGEGKRGSARTRVEEETSFVPQRLIAPAPVQPVREEPLPVIAVESRFSASPPPAEPDVAPSRSIAPLTAAKEPEMPPMPAAEPACDSAPSGLDPEFFATLSRVLAPLPVEDIPQMPPAPVAEPLRREAVPAVAAKPDPVPQRFIAPPPAERPITDTHPPAEAPRRAGSPPPFASELDEEPSFTATAVERRPEAPPSRAAEPRQTFARAYTEPEVQAQPLTAPPPVDRVPELPPASPESWQSTAPVFVEPEAQWEAQPGMAAPPMDWWEDQQPFAGVEAEAADVPEWFEPEAETQASMATPPVERAPEPQPLAVAEARPPAIPAELELRPELEAHTFAAPPSRDWWEDPQPRAAAGVRQPVAPVAFEAKPEAEAPPVASRLSRDWWEDPQLPNVRETRYPSAPVPPSSDSNRPSAFSGERSTGQPTGRMDEPKSAVAQHTPATRSGLEFPPSWPVSRTEQAPERKAISAADVRAAFGAPLYEPELELKLDLDEAPATGHLWERGGAPSVEPKGSIPAADARLTSGPQRHQPSPAPAPLRHWPPQAEVPAPAAPPARIDRIASAPIDAVPEPKPSFRPAAPSPMERPREWAPLSAAAPQASTARPPEPALKSRVAVPPPEPEPDYFAEEISDKRESERDRKTALPKLLRRLMTSGRTEFPVAPEFVSAEAEMIASVSPETSAPTPITASAASHSTQVSASSMPKVELKPIGDNLDDLRLAHREMRNTVTEQSGVLERVQDQVQMLCESSDRGAKEQQQLVDELKFFSKWAFVFAIAVSLLLFASVAFDVVLLLRQ